MADASTAASAARKLIAIARMALGGEGYLVHHLVALAVHRTAMDVVEFIARKPAAFIAALQELSELVRDARPDAASLATAFRVEVAISGKHEMTLLSQANDLPQLCETLISRHLLLGMKSPTEALTSDERVAAVRSGMLRLLQGHPHPFDAAETLRLQSGAVALIIKDLQTPWLSRRRDPAATWRNELAAWPRSLRYTSPIFTNDQDEGDDDAGDAPPTTGDVAAAATALRNVPNPIGKLTLLYLDSFEGARRAHHIGCLRTDVALTLLAFRLYQEREQRKPQRLAELADAGLLAQLPIDPFSGVDIKYDPHRRLIWSYGTDEIDNQGDFDFESGLGDALAWRTPSFRGGVED